MPLFSHVRHWLGPLDVYRYVGQIRQLLTQLQPELSTRCAFRLKGFLLPKHCKDRTIPLLVSVWGNDFTLHAHGSPLIGYLTKRVITCEWAASRLSS